MGLKFCVQCRKVYAIENTILHEGIYYCAKCKLDLTDLGKEDVALSKPGKIAHYDLLNITTDTKPAPTKRPKIFKTRKVNLTLLDCEDALKNNPDNVEALFTMGKHWYTMGNSKQAKDYFMKVLELDPNHAEAQQLMAKKFSSKKTTTAIFAGTPDEVEPLSQLARTYLDKNDPKKAKDVFLRIIELNPRHLPSHRYLTEIYLEEANYKEAIRSLNRIKTQKPHDFQIDYNLGIVCYQAGNPRRARACFREAFEKCNDPESTEEIRALLIEITKELGS